MNCRIVLLALALLALGCDPRAPGAEYKPVVSTASQSEEIDRRLLSKFQSAPIEDDATSTTTGMVNLGRALWFDPRLSRSGDVSCDTCHPLANYGMDGKALSVGIEGGIARRNTPTVYNAAEHFALFWDGRVDTLERQVTSPLFNNNEMGMNEASLLARIESIPGYVLRFREAFPDEPNPISVANVARALGAFERGLVTPSRWHRYLAGEESSLTSGEIAGLKTFLKVGCTGCHTGPQIGATMYQRAGLVTPWPNQEDKGRYEVTGAATDSMVFKVPSLLNIARTAPYFHDGSAVTLSQAIRTMGRHQLGLELSDHEVTAIEAFLGALTGEIPERYITRPDLPPDAIVATGPSN